MNRTTSAGLLALIAAALATAPAIAGHAMASHEMKGTTFTVRIENVSTPTTLQSASGATAPAPNSPGLWVLHKGGMPLFTDGKLDRDRGLEQQSEAGNPTKLAASAQHAKGVRASGVFNTPLGDDKPGPATPGKVYEFQFTATPDCKLSVATMFGQSNDLFYAPKDTGISLFDEHDDPVSGDITSKFELWDAGTEVNQEPGFGPDQGPRQKDPDAGASEKNAVRLVHDGFQYPAVSQVLKVTIMPAPMAAK